MPNFTNIYLDVNAGISVTDASPTWNHLTPGGANHEMRACQAGAGGGSVASAAWALFARINSIALVPEMWAYPGSDNSGGLQVKTYDGTGAHYNQFRINWDNLGTFAAAPFISSWKDNTYPAASPGTQPGVGDGSAIVNGSVDTGNSAYLKAAAYGVGLTAGGVADNPGSNMGSNPTVTAGSAGGLSTVLSTWSAWQSLQAATQWIVNGAIPQATTAGTWNFLMALYTGPNMVGGTLLPVVGFLYNWT